MRSSQRCRVALGSGGRASDRIPAQRSPGARETRSACGSPVTGYLEALPSTSRSKRYVRGAAAVRPLGPPRSCTHDQGRPRQVEVPDDATHDAGMLGGREAVVGGRPPGRSPEGQGPPARPKPGGSGAPRRNWSRSSPWPASRVVVKAWTSARGASDVVSAGSALTRSARLNPPRTACRRSVPGCPSGCRRRSCLR